MDLSFHGATGTVTGSRFLVREGDTRVLVDCGLYQGFKDLRERNWSPPPFEIDQLDAVVLSHAHIDHSGWLPRLVKQGYRGPVYVTDGTADLLQILLPDSAHLQEEDARFANKMGFSRHQPAMPLYTKEDVAQTLPLLRPLPFDEAVRIGTLEVTLTPAGHILGAACVRVKGASGVLAFSGDVGRPDDPLMRPPRRLDPVDWLVLESTYGNRTHAREDTSAELARVVNTVIERGGVLLIPAFAVGRTQALLHLLSELTRNGAIPKVPTYVDSPMAISVTEVFCKHAGEHRLSDGKCAEMCDNVQFVRDPDGSRRLSMSQGPMILVSASGMATGGRVLHHLKAHAPHRRNGILLVGYQAAGTRGEAIANGADEIKIHGMYVPVDAQVFHLHGLSAHADRDELIEWIRPLSAPRRTFLVHGEGSAIQALRVKIGDTLGWDVRIPTDGQTVRLG